MNLNEIIKTLRENKEFIHRQYKADVMGVFGSYSRGEQTSESDVDILVRFDIGATLFTLGGLINYLNDKLGIKADVVSERALKKELKPLIENDLVRI